MRPNITFRKFLLFILILISAYLFAITIERPKKHKNISGLTSLRRIIEPREEFKKNVFVDGEKIKFGIYSYGIRVGSGQLDYLGRKKEDGVYVTRVIFTASTLSVKDKDEVWGTKDFSYPIKVERKVSLLGKDEHIIEKYSLDKKSVAITKIVNKAEPTTDTIVSDDKLSNVFLLLYCLRNDDDIKEGKVYKINLPTQKFDLVVDSRKKIKVPLGEFDVFYIESRPPKYRIWLQAQGSRIPVKIQGLVAGGMVYLAATDVFPKRNSN
ncbi:MAG: DUF3108 domain-containing protein [Candidatus Omnitrophota bacterium]